MFSFGFSSCLHFFKPRWNNTVSPFVALRCTQIKSYTHKPRPAWTAAMWRSRKSGRLGEGRGERSGVQMQPVPPPPSGEKERVLTWMASSSAVNFRWIIRNLASFPQGPCLNACVHARFLKNKRACSFLKKEYLKIQIFLFYFTF